MNARTRLMTGAVMTAVLALTAVSLSPAYAANRRVVTGSGISNQFGQSCTGPGGAILTFAAHVKGKSGNASGTWTLTTNNGATWSGTIDQGTLVDQTSYALEGTVTSGGVGGCDGSTVSIGGACGSDVAIVFVSDFGESLGPFMGNVECS